MSYPFTHGFLCLERRGDDHQRGVRTSRGSRPWSVYRCGRIGSFAFQRSKSRWSPSSFRALSVDVTEAFNLSVIKGLPEIGFYTKIGAPTTN